MASGRPSAGWVMAAVLSTTAGAVPGRVTSDPGVSRPVPAASLTVSGGVSLGAYEAGFLHYALAAAQRRNELDLRLVTGASAGSLNTFLAVLAACGADPERPGNSLAWNTWIPAGFDQLFTPKKASVLGAASRDWLERSAGPIEEAWARGLDPRCDVVLGVSTTRVKPRTSTTLAGLDLAPPRIEEKFAVRIQGRGPGVPPRATNYVDPANSAAALLVTDGAGEIAFSELRDLLFASMSFPVLFPPQEIRTCHGSPGASAPVCRADDAEAGLYVDGGVLDNAPLRLAVRLARDGLQASGDGRLAWREHPLRGAPPASPQPLYVFVDPDASAYPPAFTAEASDTASLVDLLRMLAVGFVDAARSKELVTLLEEQPEIADHVLVPRRSFPAASAPLFALLGFFETDFRVFDFYLGMYDARRMLAARVDAPVDEDAARFPEAPDAGAGTAIGGWGPLTCLRAIFDGAGAAADACGSDDLRAFRILAQVSLDKLYWTCSAADRQDERIHWTEHCARAAGGADPPSVPGVVALQGAGAWRRQGEETDLAYTLRLLSGHRFEFRDLQVPSGRPDRAIRKIRASLGRVVGAIADAQPTVWGRLTVGRAGKLAADLVAYAPPRRVVHLTLGPTETELGLTTELPESNVIPGWLRLSAVVGARGLADVLSSGGHDSFGVLTTVGVGADPRLLSTFWSQLHVGARVGWLFASSSDYGSRPVVQAVLALTMLERFRVQLAGAWFPAFEGRGTDWSVAPGVGLEFGF